MSEDKTAEEAKADLFLNGLVTIVTDLDKGGTEDPEMVARIGSLADRLIRAAGAADWQALKHDLSDAARKSAINTFSREIADSNEKGDVRTAYAMQAVATSLIGTDFDDPRIAPGIDLLDRFITAARGFYITHAQKPN